jgi:hypothetical protein
MCNENCENKKLIFDDLKLYPCESIGDIRYDMVMVTREEYDMLIANTTILKVVERVIDSDSFSSYSIGTYLKEILAINKPSPEPDIPSASGSDEEDDE